MQIPFQARSYADYRHSRAFRDLWTLQLPADYLLRSLCATNGYSSRLLFSVNMTQVFTFSISPITRHQNQRYCRLSVSRKKRKSLKQAEFPVEKCTCWSCSRYYICTFYVNEDVKNTTNKYNTDISLSAVITDTINPAFTLLYYFEKKKTEPFFAFLSSCRNTSEVCENYKTLATPPWALILEGPGSPHGCSKRESPLASVKSRKNGPRDLVLASAI